MSSARYRKILGLLAAAVAALAGCAGNGKGLDAGGNPIGSGGTTPLTADFQSIQTNVFSAICIHCHIGGSAPQGLQLDAAHSYAMLVGVPSVEQPNMLRVKAGDPDNSYIIQKLEGAAGISGGRMPFGGPYLDQATINVIRQWITNGAPNATATGMSVEAAVKAVQRFAVAMTAPDNGSTVCMQLPRIIVQFNGDIDSNLLNSTTVVLARVDAGTSTASASITSSAAAGMASAATGSTQASAPAPAPVPLPIATSVPTGNPFAILITPRTPLTNGTYLVTLQGSLANMDAQALGNDYSFSFTVDELQ